MKVLVTGASGLIGTALCAALRDGGHEVLALRRSAIAREGERWWNPEGRKVGENAVEGVDAVVHLAGENIAGRRWSESQKARIMASREGGTRLLCDALAGASVKPSVLISASAIGYYGAGGDEEFSEHSPVGQGFLADVCRQWEAATEAAEGAGIRVVRARFGVVLSAAGGALARMLTPFKLGLGGVVGSGRQYMSWIAIDDVVGGLIHALMNPEIRGAVNFTSPNPVTNREFVGALGRVLHRPTIFPMPAFAARLAFGEMADALLLSGGRVIPSRLLESDYDFRYGHLSAALEALLDKGRCG